MRLRDVQAGLAVFAVLAAGTAAMSPPGSAWAQSGLVYAEVGGDSNGNGQLLVGTLGGPAPQVVFQGSRPFAVTSPSVSPDGRRVAYVEDNGAGKRVAVIDTDGTNHLLLTGKEVFRYGPVWSPDGTKLYFSVRTDCAGCGRTLVVAADGSVPAARVPHGNNSDPESLRRDGKFICFDYLPTGTKSQRMGIMRPDGSGRHGVGPTNLYTAAWRPHSNLIAVSRFIKYQIPNGPVIIQIQIVNAATGSWHPLAVTQNPSKRGTAYPLAWSADGTYLYYEHFAVQGDQESNPRIYRIRFDGTDKTDVTPPGLLNGVNGFFGLQSR